LNKFLQIIFNNLIYRHRIDVSMGLFNTTGKVLRVGLLGPNARTEVADQIVDGLREAFTHFQSK
jgi:aspartate aminotransferase-like enzyme